MLKACSVMLRAPWYFVEQNVIWFIQITWIGRSLAECRAVQTGTLSG